MILPIFEKDAHGEMRGVNIEKGIFGIIKDVNANDDPLIYKALTEPKELIFSNVLTMKTGTLIGQEWAL